MHAQKIFQSVHLRERASEGFKGLAKVADQFLVAHNRLASEGQPSIGRRHIIRE